MPIIQNGRTISAIRWVDEDGVERQIVQVRLGDRLIFDGTVSALVGVTAAQALGSVSSVDISAGLSVTATSAEAVGESFPVSIAAWAAVQATAAEALAEVLASEVSAGAGLGVEIAEGFGEVPGPIVGESAPGEVFVEIATGTGEVYSVAFEIPATVDTSTATATSEALAPTVTGEAAVTAIAATGSGQVYTDESRLAPLATGPTLTTTTTRAPSVGTLPIVTAGANIDATAATGTGAAAAPVLSITQTVSVVAATGSGSVQPVSVLLIPPAQRMNKSGVQAFAASTWTKAITWTADAGYPSTVISNDGLLVAGGGTMVIHAQATFGGPGTSSQTKGCRVLVNGTVVATFSGTTATNVWGGTQSVTLANGDLLTIEVYHGSATASTRELQATGTYLYFDQT